ncbi:MAG TPA: efflux RND transporter periplasmic adaptor subunit [Verrucomicrobiae bacterium]|nr:efflux RND transporter periplasmic adaptor subunit [Verrucomicrobiae bacterium]
MKRKRIIGIAVIVLIVAVLVIVRAQRVRQMENAPLVKEAPVAVQTAPVAEGRVVRTSHVLGTVVGAEESDLAPQIMARVMEIKVREGAVVQTGQLLAQLEEREFQDAVTAAKAALAATEVAYQAQGDATARDKRLFEVKAIALEEWQHSQAAAAAVSAQLEAAKQKLDQARTQLGYCRIVAPTNGVVARRLADPGDLAVPGKPLLQLVSQQTVRVRASLPPEDYVELRLGQPVTLKAGHATVDATVSRVFPAMGDSHLASLECDVSNPPPGIVSGATVGVDVQLSSATGLVVPADALLEGDNGAWVFAVANDTVQPLPVKVLDRSSDKVAIQGNVRAGEPVIVARPSRLMTLAAGMKVAKANEP